MNNNSFKELSKEEILQRLKKHDLWELEDIVLFVFGYDHQGVDWDYIIDTNVFPIRQYNTALQATNDVNPKKQLKYVNKAPHPSGFTKCHVKKGPFIKWAAVEWENEARVRKVYNIWVQYKKQSGTTAPSLQTDQAKIKNLGDQIQLQEFIEHHKNGSPKPYNANISKIAAQVKDQLPTKWSVETYRRYIKRLKAEELQQLTQKTEMG